jgi:hypothetical protein
MKLRDLIRNLESGDAHYDDKPDKTEEICDTGVHHVGEGNKQDDQYEEAADCRENVEHPCIHTAFIGADPICVLSPQAFYSRKTTVCNNDGSGTGGSAAAA